LTCQARRHSDDGPESLRNPGDPGVHDRRRGRPEAVRATEASSARAGALRSATCVTTTYCSVRTRVRSRKGWNPEPLSSRRQAGCTGSLWQLDGDAIGGAEIGAHDVEGRSCRPSSRGAQAPIGPPRRQGPVPRRSQTFETQSSGRANRIQAVLLQADAGLAGVEHVEGNLSVPIVGPAPNSVRRSSEHRGLERGEGCDRLGVTCTKSGARADRGDLELPDSIAVVAAANPPEQAASGWELSAPLANRCCHLDWVLDGRAVADGGCPVAGPQHRSPSWPRAGNDASAWLAPGWADSSGFDRCWPSPSPRSWDMAPRLLAAAGSDDLVRSLLVRGAVGRGPGVEFLTRLDEADLPDPEVVLGDPESSVLPERGDRAYAALSSIAAIVAAERTLERWQRGWSVFGRAAESAPDVAAGVPGTRPVQTGGCASATRSPRVGAVAPRSGPPRVSSGCPTCRRPTTNLAALLALASAGSQSRT